MDPRFQRLLHDSLAVSTDRNPDKPVAIVQGTRYSYGALHDATRRLASELLEAGVQRGDRVAIFADNGWPCLVSICAALWAGAAFVVVNPQTKADKLEYILRDSGARVLITEPRLSRVAAAAVNRVPTVTTVIGGDAAFETGATAITFDAAISRKSPAPPSKHVIPLDLAALIYTSGSTGQPKGVAMTHQAMTFTAGSLIEYLRLCEGDRLLNVLPLAFDYGLYQFLMTLRLGATLVLERSFTYPAQIFGRITDEEVTVFPGVPTVFMTMIGMHARNALHFPSVRRVTNTAAALPSGIVPRLREMFPQALIFRMYGLTECKRVCYLEPELLDRKPDSVGTAIPGTEVFLLSPSGDPTPPGETGILHVRGPHVMMGYWNEPDLTARMLKPGRYPGERILCTHDLFRMDDEGYLYFVGRTDDIIKTRGEKVSPIEVENCLHAIPGVREAAVIGVPDEVLGESLTAFVAVETGVTLTEQEIKGACASRLESFMVPSSVVFMPELPKTPTGKIRKKDLGNGRP